MTERRTYAKSTCCIPGCPRWSRRFPEEWMCGRHWRMIPRRCRRALNQAWRRVRRLREVYDAGRWTLDYSAEWTKVERASERLWDHARRRVILREAGL